MNGSTANLRLCTYFVKKLLILIELICIKRCQVACLKNYKDCSLETAQNDILMQIYALLPTELILFLI